MVATFNKFIMEWRSEDADGEVTLNKVIFFQPEGIDAAKTMSPLINLAELDAAEFGYQVDLHKILQVDTEVMNTKAVYQNAR